MSEPVSITGLIAAVVPATIASIASIIVGVMNKQKIHDLHIIVNSRLSELLETTKRASFSDGEKEGRKSN